MVNEKKGLKISLEAILIIIFIGTFLFLALAEPWERKIVHPFPYSYLASDAFFHQATNQYIKEQGIVINTPPYTIGGYEEVIDAHPPMIFQLTSALSILSGIPVHDNILIIAVFSFIFSILVLYLVWRQAGKSIALLALPICLLMLQQRLMPLIFWGYWLLLTGILFMVASIWAVTKFDIKCSSILIALFISASALAHQPEFAYAGLFLVLFIIVKIFKEKSIKPALIKKSLAIGVLIVILSFYSLLIFSKTFMQSEGYRNVWGLNAARGGYPEFNLVYLGVIGIIAAIGLAIFLVSKKKNTALPAGVSIFCFMLGFFVYLGIGKRAYAHRLFWVMYTSFFFGLAVYFFLKIVLKKIRISYAVTAAIIILSISAYTIYGKTRVGQGIMNQYDWDALNWISKNLPEDAYVYYFYSDALRHNAPLYNSKRLAFNIRIDKYVEAINSQKIQQTYFFSLADGYPVYAHKTGPLSFCYYLDQLKPRNNSLECKSKFEKLNPVPEQDETKNICDIEYSYFTKAAGQEAFAQYNMAIRNILLQNDWIEEIYANPLTTILHNKRPGVDCFGSNT